MVVFEPICEFPKQFFKIFTLGIFYLCAQTLGFPVPVFSWFDLRSLFRCCVWPRRDSIINPLMMRGTTAV